MTRNTEPRPPLARRLCYRALAALCAIAAATSCSKPASSENADRAVGVSASSPAEVNAAIAAARPGDTIRLKAGTYPNLVISRANFKDAITLTSLDPTHPAIIAGMKMSACSGFKFTKIEFTNKGSIDPYYGFRIQGCDNIVLDDVVIHGDSAIQAFYERAAFYITNCSNVTVSNSRIEHVGAGLVANKNNYVNFHRNLFMDISKGGIEMGASGFVNISDNVFTDFQVGRGTHPDAIQIYTATMPAPSHDISVTGNLIYRGRGNAIQGIFIQDEGTSSPFQNVSIIDNAVIGGMWDSVYLRHAIGLVVVKDNIAASWAGLDQEGSGNASALGTKAAMTNFRAYLWLRGDMSGATLSVTGNKAQIYMNNAGKMAPPPGNTTLGDVEDGGKSLMENWARSHPQLRPLLAAANLPN